MKSTLPAAHLIRQYLLFALTVIFTLTLVRAAYAFWHFKQLDQVDALIALFVQGLRFDLALVGIVCAIPVVLGSLLSMTKATRVLAKWVIATILFVAITTIILLELVTPWFIENQGLRPDLAMLITHEDPIAIIKNIFQKQFIPLLIGTLLCSLVLVAYADRMELSRFLRFPVAKLSALMTLVVGGFACALAIKSKPDLTTAMLSPSDALISDNATINDITLNTTYKLIHSVIQPLVN